MFTTSARGRRRSRGWLAAGALALATGTAGALVAASPAQAAAGDAQSGTLSWTVLSSWNNYITSVAWSPQGSITAVAPATTSFQFPVASGSVTSTTAADVKTGGGVHWVLEAHGIDLAFNDLEVVVDGTHADIYGDVDAVFTASFGSFQPGTYHASDVKIATSDSASISNDGANATITATGVTSTQAAADAGFPYAAGTALESLNLSVALEGASTPTPTPQITLSKSVADSTGDTIHVTGTGFTATLNATSPPLAGHPAGFYVAFGKYTDPWKPSEGAPSGNRKNGANGTAVKWVVPQESYDYAAANYPSLLSQFVILQPDGSFSLDLSVAEAAGSFTADTAGTYGIYTYQTGGGINAAIETFTPISFVTPNSQQIVAEVPAQPGGEFNWTVPSAPVNLGAFVNGGAFLTATGAINTVTVTDTRTNQGNAWSVTGKVGNFTGTAGSIDGKYLGWAPTASGAGAVAGGEVENGYESGNGLKAGGTLANAANGHESGNASLGAGLTLKIPANTAAGTYTATLTLTALS